MPDVQTSKSAATKIDLPEINVRIIEGFLNSHSHQIEHRVTSSQLSIVFLSSVLYCISTDLGLFFNSGEAE